MSSHQKDYYLILQVQPSAEPEVIQAAYRRLARMHHPDIKNSDATQMQELNEAYEVLSNPDRRADYDRWYRLRRWSGAPPPAWSPEQGSFSFSFPWRSFFVSLAVMLLLVVFVLDVFRIGLRGAPEITLILIVLGFLVYYFGGIKDLLE